jgi:toxin ParE1/3/4
VKRLRFHPEARIEALSSATWYRERSREAALTFTSAVTEAVQAIRERPEACAPWRHTNIRRRLLRRFPYSHFYVVENDLVVIMAVAHHKRRPGYWLPRLHR